MELSDAARRMGRRWHILVLFVGLGAVAGILLARGPETYSASTRLVLEAQYPKSRSESAAIADTAQAIATSPSMVAKALATVGVTRRDAAALAKDAVSVSPLGTSGVVKLTVRDKSPRVAAALANALAAEVIETGLTVSGGRAGGSSPSSIVRSSLSTPVSRGADPTRRSALVEERAAVQAERVNVLASEAGRSQPAVISRATPPPRADTAPITAYAALGALLGLILGIGVVGVVETVRPTIVGGDALARELDVRLLGSVASPPDQPVALATLGPIAQRLGLAADTSGVEDLALLSIGPDVDLGPLADRLGAEVGLKRTVTLEAPDPARRVGGGGVTAGRDPDARSRRPMLRIRPFDFARRPEAAGTEQVSSSSRRRCSPGSPWQTAPTSSSSSPCPSSGSSPTSRTAASPARRPLPIRLSRRGTNARVARWPARERGRHSGKAVLARDCGSGTCSRRTRAPGGGPRRCGRDRPRRARGRQLHDRIGRDHASRGPRARRRSLPKRDHRARGWDADRPCRGGRARGDGAEPDGHGSARLPDRRRGAS